VVTTRMRSVLAMLPSDRRAVLEPGVTNLDVSRATHPHGLFVARRSQRRGCSVGQKRAISSFKSADVDLVNAAGCGSAIKEYDRLLSGETGLQGDAKWFPTHAVDLSELLVSIERRAERHAIDIKIAYHDACHLAHAQAIRTEPRTLLREITGLKLHEIGDDLCCGSAGV
jgi:Cysteine-rich domain